MRTAAILGIAHLLKSDQFLLEYDCDDAVIIIVMKKLFPQPLGLAQRFAEIMECFLHNSCDGEIVMK